MAGIDHVIAAIVIIIKEDKEQRRQRVNESETNNCVGVLTQIFTMKKIIL